MRILFTFIGGSRHLRPLLPFARAAQAAGHTVAVAGPGGQRATVTEAGFLALHTSEPRPQAAEPDEPPLTAPDLLREEQTMRDGFAGYGARRHAQAVRAIALDWKPDVIVREEVDFGTAIAAESLGIACATVIVLVAGDSSVPTPSPNPSTHYAPSTV